MLPRALALTLLVALAAPAGGQSLSDAELERRLTGRTVRLPVATLTVVELLARMERALGADIHLSRSARRKLAAGKSTSLSLPLRRATLIDALGLLCELTELRWIRQRGRVHVQTVAEALPATPLVTRVYPVADLISEWIPPFPTGLPDLGALRSRPAARRLFDEAERGYVTRLWLVGLVKSSIEPDLWEEGLWSIDSLGERLVVVAPRRVQRRVRPLLERLRELRVPRVRVEAWWTPGRVANALPLAAWRVRVGTATRMVAAGPVDRALQLHDGPVVRLTGADGPVRLAVGRTLIVTASPATAGTTRLEWDVQDSALTGEDGAGVGLRRRRAGATVQLPSDRAVPVLVGGRAGAERTLMLGVTRTSPASRNVPRTPVDPRAAAVAARLARVRRDWRYDDTPLSTLAAELREALELDVVLAPTFAADDRIRLALHAASARELLDLLRRDAGIGWTVSHGVLLLTTPEHVGGSAVSVVRDLRDLHLRGTIDPTGRWDHAQRGASDWLAGFGEEEEGQLTIDGLTNLIRDNVAKDTWEGENTIRWADDGVLLIRNAPAVIREIDVLLDGLRRTTSPDLTVELVARAGTRELARVRLRSIGGGEVAWRDGEQRFDRARDAITARGDLRLAARATLIDGAAVARLQVRAALPGPEALRWSTETELPLDRETIVGGAPRAGVTLYATVRRAR